MTVVMDDPADSDEGQAADRVSKLRANPVPATKFTRVIKRLRAALRGGVCDSSPRGSTVEARGAEVLRASG